jgi:hypothetical protein
VVLEAGHDLKPLKEQFFGRLPPSNGRESPKQAGRLLVKTPRYIHSSPNGNKDQNMKLVSIFLCLIFTIGSLAQAEQPAVNYLVTENDGGVLTFQLCQIQKTEVGTKAPWKCRDLNTLSKLSVDDFLTRLESEENACHMRITGKDAKEFGMAAVLVGFMPGLPVGGLVYSLTGRGGASLLAILGTAVLGGYVIMRADSEECSNIWKLLVRRIYETALKKVPDGYQRSDLLSDAQFEIIAAFLK